MKNKILSIFVSFLFTLLFSTKVSAVIYYVATDGNDLNDGKTLQTPFLTIKKAVDKSDVTIIYVRGGTYTFSGDVNLTINKLGASGNLKSLFNYPGERPLLDFSGLNAGKRGISLGGSYWHIKGFDVIKAQDNGLYISGAYNIIEFCTFSENVDSGVQLGGGANNNLILNCDSYFNKDATSENADGFACKLDVGTNNVFKGCRSWQNSDDGWDGYLRPSDNVYTYLDSCWSFRNGYLKTGATSGANGDGNGFKMGGSDATDLRHNMTLTHCVAFYNRKRGFDQNNNRGSMTLYNNTSFKNGAQNYAMNSIALSAGSVMTVKNCISYLSTGNIAFVSGSIVQNNSWQTPFTLTFDDFSDTTSAGAWGPRKEDGSLPELTFLHLKKGAGVTSDLVDGGQNVGLSYNDAAPDLGAFETTGTVPVRSLGLNAETTNAGVILSWKMATEIQNKGWTIERSSNGTAWTDLGFVNGAGYSSTTTSYSFTDKNALTGTYHYRLKQVDYFNKITYSNAILVKIKKGGMLEVAAFPNPFLLVATIRFTVPEKSKVTLQVINEQGQLINTMVDETLEAGTYQRLINSQSLSAGKYFLKLVAGHKVVTSSILKVQ